MTITMLCNLGMSTSMLIADIKEEAKKRDLDIDIDALPFGQLTERIDRTDILLLGPQIRYLLGQFQKEYGGKIPVIKVMNMSDYGLVNGAKILSECIKDYENAIKSPT